jgi:TspO/MBR family
MKNTLRQISVVVSVLATIVINILANVLPFNGLNTGTISDSFHVYFVPAGYVFSIWGIIYIGLIAYAVYQALPSHKENPRLQATGWWVVLGGLANIAWIFLWHYQKFVGTLVAMLFLLVTLIIVYVRLGINQLKVSPGETWAVRVPFSIYLGWITVATIANISDVLDYLNWNRFGISDATWMVIVLGAVVLITSLMNFLRTDIAYALVILWALAGIAVKFPNEGLVTVAVWVAFGLVVVTLVAAVLLKIRRNSTRVKALDYQEVESQT